MWLLLTEGCVICIIPHGCKAIHWRQSFWWGPLFSGDPRFMSTQQLNYGTRILLNMAKSKWGNARSKIHFPSRIGQKWEHKTCSPLIDKGLWVFAMYFILKKWLLFWSQLLMAEAVCLYPAQRRGLAQTFTAPSHSVLPLKILIRSCNQVGTSHQPLCAKVGI